MAHRYIEKWKSADIAALHIHEQDGMHGLFVGQDQVCTPAGKWIAARERDIVYAIMQEAWVTGTLDVTSGRLFSMYATQHDLIAESFSGFVKGLPHLLDGHEVVMHPAPGPESIEHAWAWRSVAAWLAEHRIAMPQGGKPRDPRLVVLLSDTLLALDPAQQSAVMSLCYRHQASVLLALMVVLGRCMAEEYADGILISQPDHPIYGNAKKSAYRKDLTTMAQDAYTAQVYVQLMARSA